MMATTTPKITTALSTNIETEISQPKRSTNNNNTTHDDHNNNDNVTTTAEDLHNTIVAAWQTEPFNIEVACATTTSILCTQIDQLIKDGVMAYHHAEQCHDENVYYGQEMIRKDDEIHNLRVTENKHTAAVTNMMRTLDQSRTSVQINAQKAVSEAHLRAELANAISHRDEAIARDNQSQRQSILAQDEIQDLKRKLSKITQEKLKLERDSVRWHYKRFHAINGSIKIKKFVNKMCF